MKKTILASVALLLVLIPLSFWWFCQRPVPTLDGREPIAGLDKAVTVRFDAHAVPYIEARDEVDAYVAQGYITARERMFQMDVMRRSANGRMSEVFGSNALPTDRLVRTLGIPDLADREFQNLSAPAKQAVDAYARGVNAYLSQHGGRLGLEFTLLGYTPERWQPKDSLAILKYIAYKTDESWRLDDFRQRVANRIGEAAAATLFKDDIAGYGLPKAPEKPKPTSPPKTGKEAERVLIGLAEFGDLAHNFDPPNRSWGSTAFTVPNVNSRTRGALLSCDKHGALTMPAEWYLCSLNAPSLHVVGATIPGVPGVWIGRNEDIAWGSASMKADVQDIFLEQFRSEFDTQYRVGDKWVSAGVRETEPIPVRLGKDVVHKVVSTRHGPVLFRSKEAAISLSWSGSLSDKSSVESIYRLNHATKWEDFTSALTEFADPPQIFVYADRWGNTGCQAAGMIPKRTNNTQGTMLAVGSDSSAKWDGFVPFEKLPQAFVPANSTTAGANLPAIAANQRPSSGPAIPKAVQSLILGHQWNAPYRANRLLAAITGAKAPISVGDINSLQGDEFSPISAVLAKSLQQSAIATQYIDSDGLKIIDKMLRWNGQLQAGSTEASVQEAFLQVFQRRLLEPMLGREMATEYLQRWPMWTPLAESIIRDKPAGWMPPEERSYDTFFLTTLTQAMKSLKITFAESDQRKWSWGTIHSAVFRHVSPNATPLFRSFALGPVPVGGTVDTLNSSDVYIDPFLLRYNAESGPTQRMIVDMADRDKFYQSLATGQSGHLFSPHHDDQLNAWRKVDLAPVAFSPDQLIRQSKHRLQLESKYGQ